MIWHICSLLGVLYHLGKKINDWLYLGCYYTHTLGIKVQPYKVHSTTQVKFKVKFSPKWVKPKELTISQMLFYPQISYLEPRYNQII